MLEAFNQSLIGFHPLNLDIPLLFLFIVGYVSKLQDIRIMIICRDNIERVEYCVQGVGSSILSKFLIH